MALPAPLDPIPLAVADLYRACHLPPPMVLVARDAVHFSRLVRAWTRNFFPGPPFLTALLVILLTGSGLSILGTSEAEFGGALSAYVSVAVLPFFLWGARWERGVRESFWWSLPRAAVPAATGALVLWLDGYGLPGALPVVSATVGLVASALIVTELLAPLRSRLDQSAAASSTFRQASVWTWLRGAAPIGPAISHRLGTALADVTPSASVEQFRWDLVRDPGPQVLRNALRNEWSRLSISQQAEPVLGSASGSFSFGPASQVSALRESGTDPAVLPRLLGAAVRIDSVAAAISTFDRVAVVLPCGSSPSLAAQLSKPRSWRRSKRARWSSTLHWLDDPSPATALIDFAPADGVADWFLARYLAQIRDPAQRTPALKAFGVDRAIRVLRLPPVQEDAYGQLFQIGPRDAPSVFLFVRDRVVNSEGSALTHWISVPPHLVTAHEAVAWTFGMSEASYRPTYET